MIINKKGATTVTDIGVDVVNYQQEMITSEYVREDDGIIVIDEEDDVSDVEIDATDLFVKAKENFQNQNFQEALTLIIDFLELSNQQREIGRAHV